jgi:DNA-binding NarL/FixJ family response regulator
MALERVLTYALEAKPVKEAEPTADSQNQHVLTRRELEVAALVARGRTNRQVADDLVLAVSTAERHVANILRKLNLSSRTQIAAWVLQNNLYASST